MPVPRSALHGLARDLGREDRQLAILGEGNGSARLDDGTFLVKASGGCGPPAFPHASPGGPHCRAA